MTRPRARARKAKRSPSPWEHLHHAARALAECDSDDDAAYTTAEGALQDAAHAIPCEHDRKKRRR